eukprot:UC4_evm1s1344
MAYFTTQLTIEAENEAESFQSLQKYIISAAKKFDSIEHYVDHTAPIYGGSWLYSLINGYCQLQVAGLKVNKNNCETLASGEQIVKRGYWGGVNGAFNTFLGSLGAATAGLHLVCKNVKTDAIASCQPWTVDNTDMEVRLHVAKIEFYGSELRKVDDFLNHIRKTREVVNAEKVQMDIDGVLVKEFFVFGHVFQYYDQYLHTRNNLYSLIGLALIVVFVIILLLQGSPLTALCTVLTILSLVSNVYGALSTLNLKLNAFSLGNLVVTVGMGVEFSAHLTHTFLRQPTVKSPDDDKGLSAYFRSRAIRVGLSLRKLGSALLHGAVTSILAVSFISLN